MTITKQLIRLTLLLSTIVVPSATGCSTKPATGDSLELVGAEEDDGMDGRGAESVVGPVTVGSQLRTTANLNLRSGPSTSSAIYHVIPAGSLVTVVSPTPASGWYAVKHAGQSGWAYGVYLDPVSASVPSTTPSDVSAAIERAKAGVGYSYWWGHGRWSEGGVSSSAPAGSCSGSCPSCSHSGGWGADCSGYVAKIWQVPSSNASLTVDAHPYSTVNFNGDTSYWHTVSRGSVKKGDALVHNSGGSGHIFLYESGDGWGSMWAYEAKGCSYGVVHDLRTASSAYHAIRRAGY